MAELGTDAAELHAALVADEEPLPRVLDPDVVGQVGPAVAEAALHHGASLQAQSISRTTGCRMQP